MELFSLALILPGRESIRWIWESWTRVRYRLHISLDGLEYESDYLGPEITPPIDSLSLLKKGPGEEVRLCVSTHNAPDRSSYFRWMYKENWEVKAEIFMAAEKMGNTVVIYDLLTSNNWYYCWGKDSSR